MTFKSDSMPWSPQLEEDCDKLASDIETEDDEILVITARLSRLALQATEIHRHLYDDPENSGHASLHIEPLKKSLDELKRRLSNKQKQHSKNHVFVNYLVSKADTTTQVPSSHTSSPLKWQYTSLPLAIH
jgi:hypothetical protein